MTLNCPYLIELLISKDIVMSIRLFINKAKTKVFYIDIGRSTPNAICSYPISYGIEERSTEGKTIYATCKTLGKCK